jgi:hypothetical protein
MSVDGILQVWMSKYTARSCQSFRLLDAAPRKEVSKDFFVLVERSVRVSDAPRTCCQEKITRRWNHSLGQAESTVC